MYILGGLTLDVWQRKVLRASAEGMIVEKTAMIGKGAAMVVVWPCLALSI